MPAIKPFSQIPPAASPPVSGTQFLAVTGGTADNLYTIDQISTAVKNSGLPASPNFSVQYNNNGVFGGFGIYAQASHTLQLDAADAAAPNPQTIKVQSVLPGTLNTAGATWNMQGSLSTGGTNQGNIIFNTGFNGLTPAGPQTCTISIASPAVVTANNNGIPPNCPIYFTTTGALPTGLLPLTTYYVDPLSWPGSQPNTFEVTATNGGTPINTSGSQSGVHTVTVGGVVTISIASPAVITLPLHCLVPGQSVTFQTTGVLPTGISAGLPYFVIYGNIAPSGPGGLQQNTFQISATVNGPPVNTSGSQSGTHTIQIQGGTVQNPAQPTMIVGPSASTLNASSTTVTAISPSALTLNMVNASSELTPPIAFAFNMWSIGPYETIVFDFHDVPNNVDRWFMSFTPGQDYRTGMAGLSGESTRLGIGLNSDLDDRMIIGLNALDVPGFSLGPGSTLPDTFLGRAGPASWQHGDSDAAAPIAQTLQVQSVVAGTSNMPGVDWTLTGSKGTGNAAGGNIIFQTAPAGASGTGQNAAVEAARITPNSVLALKAATQWPAQTTKTANYSQAVTDRTIIFNGAGSITLTLLNPATFPGLELWVKNIANQTVVSASANVIPQVGGAATTAILAATAGKFALLKSNGTNWEIIASN